MMKITFHLLTNNDKNGGTWNTDQSESDLNVDDQIMFWTGFPLHFLYKLKSGVQYFQHRKPRYGTRKCLFHQIKILNFRNP